MFTFLLLLLTPMMGVESVDCDCSCVQGVPKTLCSSVEEARRRANICGINVRCAIDDNAENQSAWPMQPSLPDYLDSPHDDDEYCREIRVWDKRVDDYTGVRVCDANTS